MDNIDFNLDFKLNLNDDENEKEKSEKIRAELLKKGEWRWLN